MDTRTPSRYSAASTTLGCSPGAAAAAYSGRGCSAVSGSGGSARRQTDLLALRPFLPFPEFHGTGPGRRSDITAASRWRLHRRDQYVSVQDIRGVRGGSGGAGGGQGQNLSYFGASVPA